MSRTRILAGAAIAAGILAPVIALGPGEALMRAARLADRLVTPGDRSDAPASLAAAPASTPPAPAGLAAQEAPVVTASLRPPEPERLTGKPRPLDPVLEQISRYAPDAPSLRSPAFDAMPLAVNSEAIGAAIDAYRRGDLEAGDAFARLERDPVARTALEWAALRLQPRKAGMTRLRAFLAARPDWPSAEWLERQVEVALYGDRRSVSEVRSAFRARTPETVFGSLALARAEMAEGQEAQARERIAKIWREEDFAAATEAAILREFGALLGPADHKWRSDRMFYEEKDAASLRHAQAAGADAVKLLQARAAVGTPRFDKALAGLPKALQSDATLVFARAQAARRADKIAEAAALLDAAPKDAASLVDGDAWWVERRLVARKLLDLGQPDRAYRVAADHGAIGPRALIEAEFHAGWIALRHQSPDAGRALAAKAHFDRVAAAATIPSSIARAAYWQGRAAEALGDDRSARAAYRLAGSKASVFYGQLAQARLGDSAGLRLSQVAPSPGDDEFTRVFRLLYASGERMLALPLAYDAAREGGRDGELAALSHWLAERRDAPATLSIGKIATARGGALDEVAFPVFGVPAFAAAPNSAEKALVYSIARQESAFRTDAISRAGAKGLMQMLTSTARETARRAGLPFEEGRLLSDPAFNAQLGAAHLGELLAAQNGSYILTFAAYNAGPGRVRQWLAAYGDPRDPQVDPVDWIERIPFTETREYVQKILENLQIYRIRLGQSETAAIDADLRRVRSAANLAP